MKLAVERLTGWWGTAERTCEETRCLWLAGRCWREADWRVSGEGKSWPEWFQLGYFGFSLLGAGTPAGPHRVRSTRINSCVTGHSAPRTMNLQRNAIKSLAAPTKRAKWKHKATPFVYVLTLHRDSGLCDVSPTAQGDCGSESAEKQEKNQSGCVAAEHPGTFNKVTALC